MVGLTSVTNVGTVWFLDHAHVVPMQFTGDFLQLAVVFFILAIIAALVGAGEVAGVSMAIAKWFVIIFIILAIITALL